MGVCGGYQMLGRSLSDPDGVEGRPETIEGLGLLDVETVLTGDKVLRPVAGRLATSQGRFEGYEMHVGQTRGSHAPMLILDDGTVDGALSANGRIMGCYVHNLFNQGAARRAFLEELGASSDGQDQSLRVDRALDDIAEALERSFDIEALATMAGLGSR